MYVFTFLLMLFSSLPKATSEQKLKSWSHETFDFQQNDYILLNSSHNFNQSAKSRVIILGCIVPFKFQHILASVNLALLQINENVNILPDFLVLPRFQDSGVSLDDSSQSINAFISFISNKESTVYSESIVQNSLNAHKDIGDTFVKDSNLSSDFSDVSNQTLTSFSFPQNASNANETFGSFNFEVQKIQNASNDFTETLKSFNFEVQKVQKVQNISDGSFNLQTSSNFFLGPDIPEHGKALSQLTTALKLPINFVSPIISDPIFDDKIRFPNFARLVPSDRDQAKALLALCRQYNWKRIASLASSSTEGQILINEFASQTLETDVTILLSLTFTPIADVNIQPQIEAIRKSDLNIIFLAFTNIEANYILPQLQQSQLINYPYQFILINQILRTESLFFQNSSFASTVNNSIGLLNGGSLLVTNQTESFQRLWTKIFSKNPNLMRNVSNPVIVSKFIFDTANFICNVLNIYTLIEKKCGQSNSNETSIIIDNIIFDKIGVCAMYTNESINSFTFQLYDLIKLNGTTGFIRLDKNGSRVPQYSVINVQYQLNSDNRFRLVEIATINSQSQFVESDTNKPIWNTPNNLIPKDTLPSIAIYTSLDGRLFDTIIALSCIALLYHIIFIVFNIVYRNNQDVKSASPKLNVVILIGLLLVDVLAIILVIPVGSKSLVNDTIKTHICIAEVWLIMISFTLVFGTLLLKTLRVNMIFNQKLADRYTLSDWKIIFVLTFLLTIDITSNLLITFINKPSIAYQFISTSRNGSFFYDLYSIQCKTSSVDHHVVIIFVYCLKALIVIFGIYLAFKVRNVDFRQLNESALIAFCIFVISIALMVIVPLILSNNLQPTDLAVLEFFILWACAMSIGSILFIPKILGIIRSRKSQHNQTGAVINNS